MIGTVTTYADPNVPGLAGPDRDEVRNTLDDDMAWRLAPSARRALEKLRSRGSERSARGGMGRARLLAMVLAGGLVGSVGSPALAGQREEGQLLRLSDLPEGYAEDIDEDADEPGPSRTLCDLKLPEPLADAERDYNSGGAFGTYVRTRVATYRAGDAKKSLDLIAAAVKRRCSAKGDDPYRVSALNAPNVGDQAVGLRATNGMDRIYVRKGDTIATVSILSLIGPVDVKVGDLARKQANRLR